MVWVSWEWFWIGFGIVLEWLWNDSGVVLEWFWSGPGVVPEWFRSVSGMVWNGSWWFLGGSGVVRDSFGIDSGFDFVMVGVMPEFFGRQHLCNIKHHSILVRAGASFVHFI